jgi:hypothetical protein
VIVGPSLTGYGATIPRPHCEFDSFAGHSVRTGYPAGELERAAGGDPSGARSKMRLVRFPFDRAGPISSPL